MALVRSQREFCECTAMFLPRHWCTRTYIKDYNVSIWSFQTVLDEWGCTEMLTTYGAILVTLRSSNPFVAQTLNNMWLDYAILFAKLNLNFFFFYFLKLIVTVIDILHPSTHPLLLTTPSCSLPSCPLQPENFAILTSTLCSTAGHVTA